MVRNGARHEQRGAGGTDAQPYFWVFNPVSHGKKHDPTGDYVRRYVPELAAVPDAYIHAPWTMPDGEAWRLGFAPGRTYPAPVVDHAVQRQRAIAIFEQVRRGWVTQRSHV
jgi:deoxyribodipyrimidine photo-lyase